MAQVNLNISDIETANLVPEGNYSVLIKEVKAAQKDPESNPYLSWSLEIFDSKDYTGRKLTFRCGLSEKSLWILVNILRDLKVISEDQKNLALNIDDETGLLVEPNLTGLAATAVVSTQIYQGRKQSNVDTLVALEGASGSSKPVIDLSQAAVGSAQPVAPVQPSLIPPVPATPVAQPVPAPVPAPAPAPTQTPVQPVVPAPQPQAATPAKPKIDLSGLNLPTRS